MKLSDILEAERLATPGMRLYGLTKARRDRELAAIWHYAWLPHEDAKKAFLEELVNTIAPTHAVRGWSESSSYFTVSFKTPGEFYGGELVILAKPDRFGPTLRLRGKKRKLSDIRLERGTAVQIRRPGDTMVFRRWSLPVDATPATIWARVERYFDAARIPVPIPLAEAA